jgi:hypothetical protein
MSDAALGERFNDEARVTILEAAGLLMDKPFSATGVSFANFVPLVRELNELCASGSRQLGEAIIEAGDHKDAGRLQDAAAVFRRFMNACPSPFYRRIAEHELRSLGKL